MSKIKDVLIITTATLAVTASIVWSGLYGVEKAPHYEPFTVNGIVTNIEGEGNVVCVACDPDGDGEEDEWAYITEEKHYRGQKLTVKMEYHEDYPDDPYWIVGLE